MNSIIKQEVMDPDDAGDGLKSDDAGDGLKSEPQQKSPTYVTDLPDDTQKWPSHAHIVYKLFKVRTAVFDINTILWPATSGLNLNNWIGEAKIFMYCLDYLDLILRPLDIDEPSCWYENSRTQRREHARALFSRIASEIDSSDRFTRVNAKIKSWLTSLRTTLEMDPNSISEKTYEEVFCKFVEIVDLNCFRGDFFGTMEFHYADKHGVSVRSVSSAPDLLVCNVESFFDAYAVAVVDVKKDEAPHRSKRRRLGSADSSSSSVSTSGEGSACDRREDDCSALKENYPNGNVRLLTQDEKEKCQAFLPQLLGDVMAALNSPEVKLQTLPLVTFPTDHLVQKSVIGFGVVGFKVYVINFLCVSDQNLIKGPMHDIPFQRGIGMDILVTEPLDMLKCEDRKKLLKLLVAFRLLVSMNDFDK